MPDTFVRGVLVGVGGNQTGVSVGIVVDVTTGEAVISGCGACRG